MFSKMQTKCCLRKITHNCFYYIYHDREKEEKSRK